MSYKPKASLQTLGCRLNQSETAMITKDFQEQGYEIVSPEEAADVVVINTCTVTEHSDAKNRQAIRAAHRKNPSALIAVIGCYAQMSPETIAQLDGVKLVVGSQEKLNLTTYLDHARLSDKPLVINPKIRKTSFQIPIFRGEEQQTRSNLKIQDGCDFMCSFCIIPFSRGRSRCREFGNLKQEAYALVESGVKEIVMTGVNVGTYHDEKHSFVDVIDFLNEISGLERIRISSIEPTTVERLLFDYMADPAHKLVPFFHLPLQSGSNDILQQMKRRYRAEEYAEEVMKAYTMVPDLCIGTDVMVGFPGETDQHFDETFQLLDQLPLAYFHLFPFSEREGTPAVRFVGKVDPNEKQRRGRVLRELSHYKRREFQERFMGKVRTVLFESPKESGTIGGYTDNYIRVVLQNSEEINLKNKLFPVQFLENKSTHIVGELVRTAVTN